MSEKGWQEVRDRAVACIEGCKEIPTPSGLSEARYGLQLIAEIHKREASSAAKLETCVHIAKEALRACGIEVE